MGLKVQGFRGLFLPIYLTLNVEPGTCEPLQRDFIGKKAEIAWRR